MFESPIRLALGLATGIVFGVLLQKGRVAKHAVIVGQLILRDFTVLKIMLTAIGVGAIGFWLLVAAGVTPVDVKPAQMGGVVFGAALFGAGLALLGYCPGTTVAAMGEGRRDALAGFLGMGAGAALFVMEFPTLNDVRRTLADYGKVTLPDALPLSTWGWVSVLAVLVAVTYAASKARGKSLSSNRAR